MGTDTKSAISTIQSLIVCFICICLFYFQYLFYIRCRCVIKLFLLKIVFINLFLLVIFVRLPFVIRVLIRFWMTEFNSFSALLFSFREFIYFVFAKNGPFYFSFTYSCFILFLI